MSKLRGSLRSAALTLSREGFFEGRLKIAQYLYSGYNKNRILTEKIKYNIKKVFYLVWNSNVKNEDVYEWADHENNIDDDKQKVNDLLSFN